MARGFPNAPNQGSPYESPTGSGQYSAPYEAGPSAAPILPPMSRNIPTVLGLLNALKRRWVLASFLGLLAALAAAAGFWLAAPAGKHQVKAIVQLQPLKNNIDDRAGDNDPNFDNFRLDQEVLIKTRTLITEVAADEKVRKLPMVESSDDPVKMIQDLIETKWVAPTLMAIMMNGDQKEQLEKIMEVLLKKYIESSRREVQETWQKRQQLLEKARDELKIKFKNQQDLMQELNDQGMSGQSAEANNAMLLMLDAKIADAEKEVRVAEQIIKDVDARIKVAKAQLDGTEPLKPTEAVLGTALEEDRIVAAAKLRLEEVKQTLEAAIKSAPDATNNALVLKYQSEVKAATAEYEAAKIARKPEVEKSLLLKTRTDLEKLLTDSESQRKVAAAKLDDYNSTLRRLRDDRLKKNKLINTAASNNNMPALVAQITAIQAKLDDIEVLKKNDSSRIVEKEKPMHIPNPNIRQKLMFGVIIAIAAFGAVLVIVAYLEWRSRRVDSVDQVLNEANLRILGTIPAFPSRASLKAGEADMNQNWRFILNESVNSARTMLLHSARTQQMQVLMVTSAMQGEGKTSLASQLATSMATAGMRTLILDMDLRNPSMNRLFDLPLGPGASEVLLQEIDVSDAVQPTTVPNLWVIPAGQCSNRVIASLAQGHPIETLFNRLRGQFDFIVVDTCPVLPVADALLIGQYVDGVVFSILQDISQLPKVLNASERLSQLNIPLLGAVVNGIKTDVHAYGYNYVKQLPA